MLKLNSPVLWISLVSIAVLAKVLFSFVTSRTEPATIATVHPDVRSDLISTNELPPPLENESPSQTQDCKVQMSDLSKDLMPFKEKKNWSILEAEEAICLPHKAFGLVARYSTQSRPSPVRGFFLFTPNLGPTEQVSILAERVEPDPFRGLPFVFATAQEVGLDSILVLYHTESIRLMAEVYVNRYDHLVLFSKKYPKGIEVLKLGIDQGNVHRWTVEDRTLSIESIDARLKGQPKTHYWQLNLSNVL